MTVFILTLVMASSTGPVVLDAARLSSAETCAATARRIQAAFPTVQAFCTAEIQEPHQ